MQPKGRPWDLGTDGALAFSQPITDDWKATYYLSKTKGGKRILVAKVVIQPTSVDAVLHGITVDLWKKIHFGSVRRYLDWCERQNRKPETPLGVKQKRGRPSKMKTLSEYRKLKREYDELLLTDPAPAKTLALRRKVNRSTMRTWLARAAKM
jgi:hypothetical protein